MGVLNTDFKDCFTINTHSYYFDYNLFYNRSLQKLNNTLLMFLRTNLFIKFK